MGFIVFQHNDDYEKIGAKSYLSLYSLPEYSLVHSHILPIDRPGHFVGSHCNGIYVFTDLWDNIVIIDLTTKVFKPLTLPVHLEPRPEIHACGIGYDPRSNVYKIVVAYHFSEMYGDLCIFQGFKNRAHVYSLDTDSWTPVQCLDTFTADSGSVYIGHERYWIAMTKSNEQHQDHDLLNIHFEVVSFNFCSLIFDQFSLPKNPFDGQGYKCDLVEYGGMLGAVRYSDPCRDCHIWVREGQSWTLVHTFRSDHRVARVLAALKYERELIFEALCVDDGELTDELSRTEVHVVNVDKGGPSRKLKIYGQYAKLGALPFEKSEYELQGGRPLIIKSYSNDEDEEIEKKKKKKRKKSSKKRAVSLLS